MPTKKKTKKKPPTTPRRKKPPTRKTSAPPRSKRATGPLVDRIIPHLIVNDGARALAFYKDAFGAEETERMTMPDGRLMHGEVRFAGHRLFVSDEFSASEGGTCRAPHTLA